MILIGNYNTLKVIKEVDFGMYLDGGTDEILLPNRYVPKGLKQGDDITVFIYHDNEGRLIATTDKPVAVVGDIAMMEVNEITPHGAFLKWGIMKDVFIPISLQERKMRPGEKHLVQLFIDERTGRVTATEKIDKLLSNYQLSVQENDEVDIVIFQQTDIGYKVIINNKHLGVLHYNEMFREVEVGDKMRGFIKKIREGNKIDVSPGVKGYAKVKSEEERIMDMLRNNNGYLPYNDKSEPEDIYTFFGISKKSFKITLGALYKKRLIEFTQTGVKLIETT
jgi:hypothetical protein